MILRISKKTRAFEQILASDMITTTYTEDATSDGGKERSPSPRPPPPPQVWGWTTGRSYGTCDPSPFWDGIDKGADGVREGGGGGG